MALGSEKLTPEQRFPAVKQTYDQYAQTASGQRPEFVTGISQAEIRRLMERSQKWGEFIRQVRDFYTAYIDSGKDKRVKLLSDKYEQLRQNNTSNRPEGAPADWKSEELQAFLKTPEALELRDLLQEIRSRFEQLTREIAENIHGVEESEVQLVARKQELLAEQQIGVDVTASMSELEQQLEALSEEKVIWLEFFQAFGQGTLDEALALAREIKVELAWDEAHIENRQRDEQAEAQKEGEPLLQPRNDLERYLLTTLNLSPEELALPPQGLIETNRAEYIRKLEDRYDKIAQHLLTTMIGEIESRIKPGLLAIPSIDISGIEVVYRDATGSTSHAKLGNLVNAAVGGVPEIEESVAGNFIGRMFSEINTPLQSVISFNSSFNPTREGAGGGFPGYEELGSLYSSASDMLNSQFWKNLINLPSLRYRGKDGKFESSTTTLGERVFWVLREALLRNRYERWAQPALKNGHLMDHPTFYKKLRNSYIIPPAIADDPRKRNKGALRYRPKRVGLRGAISHHEGEDWEGKPLRFRVTAGNGKYRNMFPLASEKRTGLADKQIEAYETLKNDWVKKPEKNAMGTQFATAWGLALADISFEGPMGDAQAKTDSDGNVKYFDKGINNGEPQSYTLGGRVADRLMNPGGYGFKGYAENASGEQNTFNKAQLGLIYQYVFSFFDYFGYEGKTYAEHIIACQTFDDFKKIDWDHLPENSTKEWSEHVAFGSKLGKIFEGGYSSGNLQSLSKFDIEKGELTVNTKLMNEIGENIDKFCRYHIEADCAPTTVTAKPTFIDANGIERYHDWAENPTGQFIIYRIVTEEAFPKRNEYAAEIRKANVVKEKVKDSRPDKKKELAEKKGYIHESYRADELLQLETADLARWFDSKGYQLSTTPGMQSTYEVDPSTGQGFFTIVVKPTTNEPGPLPKPVELINWQVFYSAIFAPSFRGEDIVDIDIEDVIILGMMMSDEIIDWVEQNKLKGIFSQMLTQVGRKISPEFALTVVPNIFKFKQRMSAEKFIEFLLLIGIKQKNIVAELSKEAGFLGKK